MRRLVHWGRCLASKAPLRRNRSFPVAVFENSRLNRPSCVVAENVTFWEVGGGSLAPKPCLQSERLRASVHERHRLTAGELGMIRDGFDDLLDRSRDKLRVYCSRYLV